MIFLKDISIYNKMEACDCQICKCGTSCSCECCNCLKKIMDNFNTHKWFKKQYLEEGHTEDKMKRDQAIKRYDQLSDDDKLKLAKIQKMMDRERSLKEDNIEENRLYPDYDDIIELIKGKTVKNNSSEIDEAMEAMEFIGQHYGINFEFGRG